MRYMDSGLDTFRTKTMARVFAFFKRKIVWIPALAVVLILTGSFLLRANPPEPELVAVRRGTVVQEVSVTGKTTAADAVQLAFERSGRVVRVGADVGDRVVVGAVVAELDAREVAADLARARAMVEVQRARLAELRRGTRPEEIAIAEAKRANAVQGLRDADRTLADKILDAYAKADDAVRYRTDPIFIDPRSSNPRLNFLLVDPTLALKLEEGRASVERALNGWDASLAPVRSGADPAPFFVPARAHLGSVSAFLDVAAEAVNSLTRTDTLPQAIVDGYRAGVSTARANVHAAVAGLSAAAEARSAAQANVTLAEEELALQRAGATPDAIASQEAQVREAEAGVGALEVQLGNYVLRSPIAGIVTKRTVEAGEMVAAQTPVVAVISANRFEIEANVPEADIAKLKLGQRARVTLDAYGSEVPFGVRISAIDPGETVIDGVPTYRVTFQFDESDERVRSGMTANIEVTTATRTEALVLPQRAIGMRDGKRIVRILGENVIRVVQVQTGLRGVDGNVEILSGVREGERVIVAQP